MLSAAEALAVAAGRPLPIYLEGRLFPVTNEVSRELGLSLHDVVRGIVELRPEGLTLILNGKAMVLPQDAALRAGEQPWLRLVNQQGRQALMVVAGPAAGVAAQESSPQGTARPEAGLAASLLGQMSPSHASLFVRPADLGALFSILQSNLMPGVLSRGYSMARLTPDMIKQALKLSGLFTESLLHRQQPVQGDLKVALTALLSQIRGEGLLEEEWSGVIESTIRELNSAQADALVAQSNRELLYNFFIPFKDAPPAQVRFFRFPRSEQEEGGFIIDVHTRGEPLGDVWLTGKLAQERDIQLTMWAERADIARDAKAAIQELAEDLLSAGLKLISMQVIHGRQPSHIHAALTETAPVPGSVVDRTA
ncbi:MAG: hypothetical protein RLY30_1294 [Pseudomonadota bacterium]